MIAECTRLLTQPLASYVQRVPNNVDKLKRTLQKGDVVLVEGDQRVSQVIRYLTQSSWSHCALYVGDELLKGDPQRAALLRARFGDEAQHLVIEAEQGNGVCASPIAKYQRYNIRICRPQGLHREDVDAVLGYVIGHLGRRYNARHIVELARFFFPVSIVPQRWRRAALTFGSSNGRAVICSSMIADAFARIGYPILPDVTLDDAPSVPQPVWRRLIGAEAPRLRARFRSRSTALITPRDYDLSPYFEVVKFNHLGDPRLNYREIIWEDAPAANGAVTNGHAPAPAAAVTAISRLRPAFLARRAAAGR
ncbi:MAG: YiiX/YebB-like N1pC/P60 family cysteine hydrolase [Candidatus Binatia bacterium]